MSQDGVDVELNSETSSVDEKGRAHRLACGPTILAGAGGDGVLRV